jgi:hypothetical protein
VAVTGQDQFGNTVTTFTGNVTVAIGTNPGTGTLSGTLTQPAFTGVATFANLSINKAGSGYTLVATATGASDGTSLAFNITPGLATMLVFTTQPAGSTTAGTAIGPPLTVAAQDAQGNTDPTFTGDITMAIGTNGGTPTPGTLSGTTVITASGGTATFSNLSINRSGTGYTLQATSGALTPGVSNAFAITAGAATKLTFTVQPPASTTAGVAMAPAMQVSAQDALNNTDPNFTGSITVGITGGTGTANATLSGTKTQTASTGVASFAGLSVDSAGLAYTLTATAATLTDGVSAGFDILAGTATQLVITVQPTTAVAGSAIAPTVTVAARDALGNRDLSFGSSVSMVFVNNAGNPALGTLSNATVTAAQGLASFPALSIDKVGTGYTIRATDGALNSATSSAFNILPGLATQLAFTVQPSGETVNATISPAVKVTALDANGNVATGFSSNVTVAKNTGPGNLNGTVNMAAVSGVATFSTLNIDAIGDYTLVATSGVLAQAISNLFTISPSVAATLFFSGQPNTTTAGATINPVTVEARDASGQLATSFGGGGETVTLTITPGTGTAGAVLLSGSSTTQPAAGGIATFSDLSINVAGSSYKLTATATGVTSANSKFFSINPDVPDHLAFQVQPSNATALAAITPQVEVAVEDQFDNRVTAFVGNVSMAITAGTGAVGAVLGGTLSQPVSNGVAGFGNLSIDLANTSYQLDATADLGGAVGVTTRSSTAFDITPAVANRLVFTTQPTTTTAGVNISPAVVLTAQDGGGSTLTGFTGDVTVTITAGTGTNGATLSGTTTATSANGRVVNGVATFDDLNIDKRGTGYRLSATATGLAGATSNTFTINSGAATQVVFTTDPVTTAAGQTMAAVVVQARDAFGNLDNTYVGDIALAISSNPGGGTLSGTTTATTGNGKLVGGVATFNDLSIDKSGTGYQLQASSGALATDLSQAFSITGGAVDHLTFTVAPSSAQAGDGTVGGNISSPSIRVTAFDALGNVATGFDGPGNSVTLALTPGTGTPGAVLGGTVTVDAASGVAVFATPIGVDKVGTGYTLSATTPVGGVTGATSATFDITPFTATKLGFIVQPSNAQANVAIAPPVQVAAQDRFGNIVPTYSGSVTIVIGINAGGAGTVLTGGGATATLNGVATFSGLSINNTGNGYTLSASSSPALTGATSNAFNITP